MEKSDKEKLVLKAKNIFAMASEMRTKPFTIDTGDKVFMVAVNSELHESILDGVEKACRIVSQKIDAE